MSSISAGTTTTTGYVVTSDTTGALVLKTGASNTTAVTIDASQNVTLAVGSANGLAFLNASKVLTSGSSLTFDGTNLALTQSGNPTMTVKATGAGNNPLYRLQADTNYWEMLSVFSDANDTLRFRYNGSDKLTLNRDGTVALAGGDSDATGTGITFPATQNASSNANTLDDYEEGTFTPTAFGATTTGTTTYSVQSGSYTKIGRQVTIVVATYWSAMTGTGGLRIGNLPFTSSSDTPGSILIDDLNWDGGSQITPLLVNGESAMRIYYCGDNIPTAQQQCVNESAGMRICLTYFTT